MWTHIAAVSTAVVLAAAGNWGAAAAHPATPAPTQHSPVTAHTTITPAGGHHATACAYGECIPAAILEPGPVTLNAGVVRRTDPITVTRSDCPNEGPGAGYRLDAPGSAPLIALALHDRDAAAGLQATVPGRVHGASACAA